MTLTLCRDLSAADWIAHSDLPWRRLVRFGPGGFDAYARLRFLPDPERPGQREHEAGDGGRLTQLPTLLEVLATRTATPDDCYFCVWEGVGHADVARSAGAARPAASPSVPRVPKVVVPNRAYWLFRGPLSDAGTWDDAHGWPRPCRLGDAWPAFVWPADRAWCIAADVDPHFAGIGGSSTTIDRLLAHPGLDVVAADPRVEPPLYR